MTMTFAINSASNDLVVGKDGKLVIVTGADEVRQRILVTLLHDYQEYFLNTQAGTPWYELILGSKDMTTVSAVLRQIILTVPGVVSIVRFSLGLSGRNVTLGLTVEVNIEAGDSDIIDLVTALTHPIELLALNQNYNYITDDHGNYLTDDAGNFLVE